MNISRENIDELNAVLKVQLVQEDYEERVDNVLKDYRKKAKIDGFRPGKVPFGMIKKMYRTPVLVEEVNKLVSESITKYLIEEKLNILGEPLPNKDQATGFDWEKDIEFEFKFDLGIAPEVDIKVTPKDKIPFYTIKVDDEMIEKYMDSYASRMGSYQKSSKGAEEKDLLKADICKLDSDGKVMEGGHSVEDASMTIDLIKDEEIKKSVIGSKEGDVLSIDLKKAYPNDAELTSLLKVTKEELANLDGDFQLTIKEVSCFVKAEINQELWDKIYGEGNVKSIDEFKAKITEEATLQLKNDSEYKFRIDAKEAYVKKFKKDLPTEFLKRWLFEVNKGNFTEEQIDEEFDKFAEDLKWQLIKDKIAENNEIKVNEEDIREAAKEVARMQFAQYGMANVPDEHLDGFVDRMIEKDDEKRKIAERKLEDKILDLVKETVKLDQKEVTLDKFNKMFEK